MSVTIKYCSNCNKENITHSFQDSEYGKYVRVFNTGEKNITCSVCNVKIKN